MDDLIIKREIQLKGKERAKLKNSGVYRWKEGVWLGEENFSIGSATPAD